MHTAGCELRVSEMDRSREDREGRGVCMDTVRPRKELTRATECGHRRCTIHPVNKDHFFGAVLLSFYLYACTYTADSHDSHFPSL